MYEHVKVMIMKIIRFFRDIYIFLTFRVIFLFVVFILTVIVNEDLFSIEYFKSLIICTKFPTTRENFFSHVQIRDGLY